MSGKKSVDDNEKKSCDGVSPHEEKKEDEKQWDVDGYPERKLTEILELPDSARLAILVASAYEIECKNVGIYKALVHRFTGGNNQPFGDLKEGEYHLHLSAGSGENWIVEYVTDSSMENEISTDVTTELSDKLNNFDIKHREHGAT